MSFLFSLNHPLALAAMTFIIAICLAALAWNYASLPRVFSMPLLQTWVVTLDVSRVWKGVVGKRFVLHVVQMHEDDAFKGFEQGSEYLVFAIRNSPEKTALFHLAGPTYGASTCGGTTSLLWGMSYLLDLGPGKSPE
jgi:hypothetical protein